MLGLSRRVVATARPLRVHVRLNSSSSSSSSSSEKLSGWRKYAEQFKDKPASFLTAFLLLHEVTAIVPLPIVYYTLSYTGLQLPIPESILEESNARIARVVKRYGWQVEPDSQVMVNLVTTYGIVKALMPVRLAVSAWMTPWVARNVVERVVQPLRRMVTTATQKKS